MLLYSFAQVSDVTRTVKSWYLGKWTIQQKLIYSWERLCISTVIVVPGIDLNFNDRRCIFKVLC